MLWNFTSLDVHLFYLRNKWWLKILKIENKSKLFDFLEIDLTNVLMLNLLNY